jgi:serine/threonine-protein kinase
VLDALQNSHQAGIIHRDIKPANVMLTSTGQVKVMDFGIARAVADTSASMTQTAAVIGTAQYLSPEQARGETVDNRSDVYAAGCLLYELLVGEPPFKGDSPVSVAYQHVRELPVRPSSLDPVITPEMDAITLKALEKDPDNRYQSAKEMRDDIGRLLGGLAPTAQLPVVPPVEQATMLAPIVEPVFASTGTNVMPQRAFPESPDSPGWQPRRRRSRVGLVIGILAAVLAVALIGGYAYFQSLKPPAVAQVAVPRVLSMTLINAQSTLADQKLKAEVKNVEGPDDATVNTVTAQSPEQGVKVDENSTVTITINVGQAKVAIPNGLTGQKKDAVAQVLAQAGFTKVTLVAATTEPPTAVVDTVVSVNPAEGALVAKNTPITVTYATGKSPFPNLKGYTQADAVKKAKDLGFMNVTPKEQVSDQLPGTVIDTDPKPDAVVDRTAPVTIFVAKAPPSAPPSTPAASSTPSSSPGG